MSEPLSSAPDHILFIDDDPDVLQAASLLLTRHGLRVSQARGPAEAWSVLAAEPVDAILLDLNFTRGVTSGEEGFQCLNQIIARDPEASVVVITGHSGVNIAVAAMRAGASDFVMKPWNNARLVATVEMVLAERRRRASRTERAPPETPETLLLGESPAIQRVRDLIRRAAPTEAPVLILGEAGTGKDLIARALHHRSARAAGPFIPVDLGALTAEEADAALFGDEARGGTLFLDAVDALTPRLQRRLLAALDLGPRGFDSRVIAASRLDRERLRGRGGLGEDLFYRLSTVEIAAPALRERPGDALPLAEHFLRLYARRYGRPIKRLSAEAAEAIASHPWPGEVRALRQAMERCVIFAEGERYETSDLAFGEAAASGSPAPPLMNLVETERALVAKALKNNSFNVSHAAKALGLTRAALYRRMAKHGL